MFLRLLIPLFCFFLSPLLANEKGLTKTTYIYRKEVRGRLSKAKWILEKTQDAFQIIGETSGGKTLIKTSPQMDMQSFTYQSKNEPYDYSIFRDGSYLIIQQNRGNEKRQREFNIKNRNWVQEFDFSFRPYILSSADTYKFYIVHPKKLSLHSLIATKIRNEQIEVNHEIYQAIKVKITLTGLKKLFWKAELWYERETGDLLKYVANEGPNTPTSIITLLSKESEKLMINEDEELQEDAAE